MELFCNFYKPCLRLRQVLNVKNSFCRHLTVNISQERSAIVCEKLNNRTLIKLLGKDASNFLQGVVTSDINQLDGTQTDAAVSCTYSMVLNVRGFVFCDIFIYKIKENKAAGPLYLLECDKTVESELLKHLKLYKLRRKVEISSVQDMAVWAAFSDPANITTTGEMQNITPPVLKLQDEKIITHIRDPRISTLGYRMILQNGTNLTDLIPSSSLCDVKHNSKYKDLRYKIGVGEGIEDHPPHKCFLQECNTDFLNGVSYHKGCYIGQELVSRVHYTGVVRRRIMPIVLTKTDGNEPEQKPEEYNVLNEKGGRIGKFRSHNGKFGLALLKISDAMKSDKLIVEELGIEFKASRPEWWPKDLTKE